MDTRTNKVPYNIFFIFSLFAALFLTEYAGECHDAEDKFDFGSLVAIGQQAETTLPQVLGSADVTSFNRWTQKLAEYECVVTSGRKFFSGQWLPDNKMRFYKRTSGGGLSPRFEYETMDMLVSFYPLQNPENQLLTIWKRKDSYHIVVFSLVDDMIGISLADGSAALPELVSLGSGTATAIIVWKGFKDSRSEGTSAQPNSAKSASWEKAAIYTWDGETYDLSGKRPWIERFMSFSQ